MFRIRKRPQPRGFCSPSSFASRSGASASGISRLAAVVGDARRRARRRRPDARSRPAARRAPRCRARSRSSPPRRRPSSAARAAPAREPSGATASATRSLASRSLPGSLATVEGDVELGAAGRGGRSGVPRERDERDVVLLLPAGAGEAAELGEHAVDHLAACRCARRRRPAAAGSRTSRASAACASATPSEWSSIVWPGSSCASVSS